LDPHASSGWRFGGARDNGYDVADRARSEVLAAYQEASEEHKEARKIPDPGLQKTADGALAIGSGTNAGSLDLGRRRYCLRRGAGSVPAPWLLKAGRLDPNGSSSLRNMKS
jgi:hypothetical protein